jgi:predicted transcriptional regulator
VTSVLDDLSPGPELRAALEAAVGEGEEEEDWGGMLPTGEIAWVSEVDRLQELFKRKPGR